VDPTMVPSATIVIMKLIRRVKLTGTLHDGGAHHKWGVLAAKD
jgi:hypothetical protein